MRTAGIAFDRGSQGSSKRLENSLRDVMRIVTSQVVNVQRRRHVVDKTLEKLVEQVNVELTDAIAPELDVIFESGTPGKINHDT